MCSTKRKPICNPLRTMNTPNQAISSPAVLPYLTSDLPAIGGRLKECAEDFLVEEIPQYDPAGEGEHIYLFVEKHGLTTHQLAAIIARHFNVKLHEVGYAGLKDKRAITRQVISVHTPGKTPEDFPELLDDRIKILWTDIHRNKLRLGHLRGNRFSVRLRGVELPSVLVAQQALERLRERGVPNYFGGQRFGTAGLNHKLGSLAIRGEWEPLINILLSPNDAHPAEQAKARELFARGSFSEAARAMPWNAESECAALRALAQGATATQAVRAIKRPVKRIWVSAFQSQIFNTLLAGRLTNGTFDAVYEGDIAYKHDSGAAFQVDALTASDPETAARAQRMEISASGPMWGHKMMRAAGDVDEKELAALQTSGVSLEDLARFHHLAKGELPGERRSFRVAVSDPEIEGGADEHGVYIRLAFELPPGSYATSVVREIAKPELSPGELPA